LTTSIDGILDHFVTRRNLAEILTRCQNVSRKEEQGRSTKFPVPFHLTPGKSKPQPSAFAEEHLSSLCLIFEAGSRFRQTRIRPRLSLDLLRASLIYHSDWYLAVFYCYLWYLMLLAFPKIIHLLGVDQQTFCTSSRFGEPGWESHWEMWPRIPHDGVRLFF
jgi:hypothetical protein